VILKFDYPHQEVIKKLTAEDDLEEIYSQYQEENLKKDILVKYCNMCKNESAEDVYDLCKTNKTKHEERKAGHAGQENAAKKMLQVHKYKYKFDIDNKLNFGF